MRSLQGKRVLITGAGRGLGRALAWHFARAGAEILATDREPDLLETLLREFLQAGLRIHAYPLDVTESSAILALHERIRAEVGPIDVLINNAGIVQGGPFLEVPLTKHRQTFEVNLLGLTAMTQAFLPDLIGRPESHLVNIASASAFVALPWGATYAASKWAVLGFTDSLREELLLLGHRHVGVSAVCPGYIDTGLFAGAKPPLLTSLLSADRVAAAVVRAVRRKQQLVVLPWTVGLLLAGLKLVPRQMFHVVCRWLRVNTSMVEWKGRQ